MTQNRRLFLLGLAGLPVAGCTNLRPLYGTRQDGPDVAAQLAQIQVPEVLNRPGQLVRNELLSIMSGNGAAARYKLALTVSDATVGVSTLYGTTTYRYRYTITGAYRLIDLGTGKVLDSGSSFSSASFDTVRQPIADLQARNDAMQRTAIELAQDIRLRVAAYFSAQG